jgi:hypothetical protein
LKQTVPGEKTQGFIGSKSDSLKEMDFDLNMDNFNVRKEEILEKALSR